MIFFGLLGFVISYHQTTVKDWLKHQIITQTKNQELHIIPEDIDLNIFPLSVDLYNIKFKTQKSLNRHLSDFEVKKLNASLNIPALFSGYFLIKELRVQGTNLTFNLGNNQASKIFGKKSNSGSAFLNLNTEDFFKYLDLPISSIIIEKTQLQIRHLKRSIQWKDLFLKLSYDNKKWSLFIKSPDFAYQTENMREMESNWEFKTNLQLSRDDLFVSSLYLVKKSNYLHLFSGHCSFQKKLRDCQREYQFYWRSHFDLKTAQNWLLPFYPSEQLKQVNGALDISSHFTKKKNRNLNIKLKTTAQRLQFKQFYFGKVELEGSFQENQFASKNFVVTNRANRIDFKQTVVHFDENLSFQTSLDIDSLELDKLLTSFQVKVPYLKLSVRGSLPCEGYFLPEMQIHCQSANIEVSDFVVHKPKNEKRIVALRSAQVQGDMVIDKHKVTINSKLAIGETEGIVNGHVNYKSGFLFNFSTPQLNFSDIESLSELRIEGNTALEGSTKGTSQSATISINLKAKDVWFEDYGVGHFESHLGYKKGILSFQNINGVFGNTKYQGKFDIDLPSSKINAQVNSDHLDLSDLRQLIKRKYFFPLEIQAMGRADLKVWGPLQFNRLSYDMNVDTQRVTVSEESFDKLIFHVKARNGEFETKQVEVHKGLGRAIVSSGVGHPNGQINIQIKGSHFYLGDSEFLKNLGYNITGQNNFNISLQGHVFTPEINIIGQIEGFHISNIPISMPRYNIKWSSEGIYLNTFLENQTLTLETLIPLNSISPLFIKLNMNKWDFSPAFALLKQEDLITEYETSISGKIDISSLSDWIWQAHGLIQLDEIIMQRGQSGLYLRKPSSIQFENGKMNINNLILTGDNTQFKIEAKDSQKNNLNLSFNGKIDTYIMAFLTPFLEESRGALELNYNLRGSTDRLQMMGSAYIKDGYAKLKDFPHPFENLKIDVLFSEKNIILTNFYTNLTTGNITADGRVTIEGWKNLPTKILAKAKDIQLNIPNGVLTRGNGEIEITRSWFPFLFKGTYIVDAAQIEKDFENEEDNSSLSYSNLLPESLLKKRFSSIEWDVLTSFRSNAYVSNSFIDGGFFGDLRLLGSIDNPYFLGEIHFRKDSIFKFRDTPFKITKASLRFPNRQEIDPIISLVASTQVKEYDVNISIQGTGKEPMIYFESTPTLPERDIINLIALGFTSEEQESLSSGEQVGQQALKYIGIGKVLKDRTGLEMNFSSTREASEDFEDIPKVTVKKQWGSQLSTSISRRLGSSADVDPSNSDPVRESPKSDVKVEYQLDNNLSVLGMWENRERHFNKSGSQTDNLDADVETENVLGLDLKYEIEFK